MGGDSVYYGLNAISNNMIMADRKRLKNANGIFLGSPGSGKSFAAKRELTHVFFTTEDVIRIVDPENEYAALAQALNGVVVEISANSKQYINPMDINLDYADDDNPLGLKSEFILSLIELIMNSKDGIEPEVRSIVGRCLPIVYQKYFEDPRPENMPVLGDLYECLREQKEDIAQRIATILEIYVNGTLNVFNHRTNIDYSNRIICYNIKDLGKQLKKLGMLIIEDQIWNTVSENRDRHMTTWVYLDEIHLLLKEQQTASYTIDIWKRFRKWGGIPSGLTQNVKDLLNGTDVENILENSDFIVMLNQGPEDRRILEQRLNISKDQLSYVTNSPEGEGLLFYGNVIVPFKDKMDRHSRLYELITTKPEEVRAIRKKYEKKN